MAGRDGFEHRVMGRALLLGEGAASAEAAPGRDVQRRWDVAGQRRLPAALRRVGKRSSATVWYLPSRGYRRGRSTVIAPFF